MRDQKTKQNKSLHPNTNIFHTRKNFWTFLFCTAFHFERLIYTSKLLQCLTPPHSYQWVRTPSIIYCKNVIPTMHCGGSVTKENLAGSRKRYCSLGAWPLRNTEGMRHHCHNTMGHTCGSGRHIWMVNKSKTKRHNQIFLFFMGKKDILKSMLQNPHLSKKKTRINRKILVACSGPYTPNTSACSCVLTSYDCIMQFLPLQPCPPLISAGH